MVTVSPMLILLTLPRELFKPLKILNHYLLRTRKDIRMEYIDIISKEAVTRTAMWPMLIVSIVAIVALLTLLVYSWVTKLKKQDLIIKLSLIFGFGGICLLLVATILSSIFLQVPTGQYMYKATIDKEKITVAEYEQFIEEYNPDITDGIYSWIGD